MMQNVVKNKKKKTRKEAENVAKGSFQHRKWSVQHTVQNRKRHSQPRLVAKGSFKQGTVKFMASTT